MNRLDSWRKNVYIRHPEDIRTLRAEIFELESISDSQIQDMYETWSEEFYCAGWHFLWPEVIQEFKEWLLEEV